MLIAINNMRSIKVLSAVIGLAISRMPQERLPKQALLAKANGRRPVGRPRTR